MSVTHARLLPPAGQTDREWNLVGSEADRSSFWNSHPTERFMLDAFEHSRTGLVLLNTDANVQYVNQSFATLLGRPVDDLQQGTLDTALTAASRTWHQQQMSALLAGTIPAFVMEVQYVRPDGREAWALESVSILRDEQQQMCWITMIVEDITQRKLAEHALVENEPLATMGRLSASIAHELNNPLESVTNLLYLIGQCSQEDEMRYYAGLAEQELQRVTKIATQTLRFCRTQSEPAPVDLSEVLDGVLALFAGRLRNEQVEVIRRYLPGARPLVAISGELRQVFVNLVGNALDAMNGPSRLQITVRPSRCWASGQDGVRVVVADSGSGIPQAMLQRVFEPFVTTKEQRGTGLGLWISRDIVLRQGGTFRVRSAVSGPGRGTCMSIFLPYAKERADAHAA